MKWYLTPIVVVAACAAATAAELKSGLQVGESAGYFEVHDVTGPKAGDDLCYRWAYGARPVVAIITRKLTDDLASLVKQVDEKVGANKDKKMASFVVVLSEDPAANEAKLKELAKKQGIKDVPLTTFADSSGPESYKVSKDAEVTVLLWVGSGRTVKANHAFAPGKLDKDGIKAVLDDTAKILQ